MAQQILGLRGFLVPSPHNGRDIAVTRPADTTNDQIHPAASRSCVCGHLFSFLETGGVA
jgi:hypothetical protein